MPIRTLILGAAGRDFHNFNVLYRHDRDVVVVGFTATQIPDIAGRRYPAVLAGALYPAGIPIWPEDDLPWLIAEHDIDQVIFSYSDVSYQHVMRRAAIANAAGATFVLVGARQTMLRSRRPVISICAVRTGAGKSPATRRVTALLRQAGLRPAVVRHPMPYGDLAAQRVQRFASLDDLVTQHCTIEEIEEYEPHLRAGTPVHAGVDYAAILANAEADADVIVWDGGNNDTPFFHPTIHLVVADPLRVGDELSYYPGETNLRMADAVIINKVNAATASALEELRAHIRAVAPRAVVVEAASMVTADHPEYLAGRRVLVVEDGPSVTHGGLRTGAGTELARASGAAALVDPRPYAVGSLITTFEQYPTLGCLLPAMGYSPRQVRDLEATIAAVPCDAVVIGTPVDLTRLIAIRQPVVRVRYEMEEVGPSTLEEVVGIVARRLARGQSLKP
ncbi:MAG: cyclic 2,3-diphosphoglycerate synthase [Vicinamibacterales bacterium]